MFLTDAQLDAIEADLAAEDGLDDPDPYGRTIGSLWRLQERCNASHATAVGRRIAVDAQIEACVAATELIGLRYERIDADWFDALMDLMQLQRDTRAEFVRRRIGDRDQVKEALLTPGRWDAVLQEADEFLIERIDGAIRRWEERIAQEESDCD